MSARSRSRGSGLVLQFFPNRVSRSVGLPYFSRWSSRGSCSSLSHGMIPLQAGGHKFFSGQEFVCPPGPALPPLWRRSLPGVVPLVPSRGRRLFFASFSTVVLFFSSARRGFCLPFRRRKRRPWALSFGAFGACGISFSLYGRGWKFSSPFRRRTLPWQFFLPIPCGKRPPRAGWKQSLHTQRLNR